MATKATSKKIKELKGVKPENISKEDLQKVQTIIGRINQTYLELGRLEGVKHNHLHTLAGTQDELTLLQNKLKEDYGTDDINIQNGAINYGKDVKADS
jgi:hypothetical protein|tara:strand:+ start:2325 stop:2618 length:294 start_codon:yes stop_codon:yes gene_type:complete